MTTYYVSPTGNDSNDGSVGSPWLTMTKAAATLVAGDIALFADGTYTATTGTYESVFSPTNSGTVGNPITFKSLNPRGAILAPRTTQVPVWCPNTRNYIVLDGFYSTGHIAAHGCTFVTIKNCEVINGGTEGADTSLNWGINLHGSNDCLIQNNYVHDLVSRGNTAINTAGIMVGFGALRNVIENNLVDGRGGSIYSCYGQKGGNIANSIWRNNIARNGRTAFLVRGSTDQTLFSDDNSYYGNIVYNMQEAAFYLESNARRTLIYNNTALNVKRFVYGGYLSDAAMGNVDTNAYNNIVSGAPTSVYMRDPTSVSWPAFLTAANYNLFYNVTRVGRWEDGASGYTTLADWQAGTPFDDNSLTSDPLLANVANMDYSLSGGSPAIGTGSGAVNMGAFPTGSETVGPSTGLRPQPAPQNVVIA